VLNRIWASVQTPIPTPACEDGNGLVRSLGGKAQGRSSHQDRPGNGKIGRMNLLRPRHAYRPNVVAETVLLSHRAGGAESPPATDTATQKPVSRTPGLRGKGFILPSRISIERNVVTPMGSGSGRSPSQPTARAAQLPSGHKTTREAKAGSRKAEGIHNLPDRALPNLKGC
jgi:hypothetical protein